MFSAVYIFQIHGYFYNRLRVQKSILHVTIEATAHLKLEMAKKGKKAVVNPHKRPLPNRAPKKGDRIEYQWDEKGVIYKKGLVERGGKNTMKIKWDEEGLQATVDVKGKEGWWFLRTETPREEKQPESRRCRRKKMWWTRH